MNPTVIIPTYIRDARSSSTRGIQQIFDHTTALGNKGELPRCLESLQQVNNIGQIIVLVASDENISEDAEMQVHNICRSFKTLHTAVFGVNEVELVQQRMDQLELGTLYDEVGLTSYGAIRNFGLVLADILGFDSVVFIDDDEIVEDPDFLNKAIYGLGKMTRSGVPILAKSGYYRNARDSYLASTKDHWYDRNWPKRRLFNEWIQHAMGGKRLSRSNHSCGGCLALSESAYKRVAFDPYIARGEDLDYLLNLRMYGADMWFDNQWSLKHLPPRTSNEGMRFRQDVYRWVYEYRKLEFSRTQIDLLQIKPSSLEPYPGPFLGPDIFKRVKSTARARMTACSDKMGYAEALRAANSDADAYATNQCERYFQLQFVWENVMTSLKGDTVLRTALVQSVASRSLKKADTEAGAKSRAVTKDTDAAEEERADRSNEERKQSRRRARKTEASASWASAAEAAERAAAASKAAEAAIEAAASGEKPSEEVDEQTKRSFDNETRSLDPGATTEINLNIADYIDR